jgi:hypothetical protein
VANVYVPKKRLKEELWIGITIPIATKTKIHVSNISSETNIYRKKMITMRL